VTLALLERAADLSMRYRLLTNDAITIAVMDKLGLSHLITNDGNFDALPGLSVWKPR
jgi:predicted nucleic acid-binding protein